MASYYNMGYLKACFYNAKAYAGSQTIEWIPPVVLKLQLRIDIKHIDWF